jgi:type IV secretion system protein VirB11
MTDQKPEHNSIKERAKKKLERDMVLTPTEN